GLGLDPRPGARPPLRRRAARRDRLDQRLAAARPAHALRGHGPVRPRPRRRPRGHALLHRTAQRLHRDLSAALQPATHGTSMYRMHDLLERNRIWSQRVEAEDPGFFARLSKIQHPKYLWIGCSDSRVPANQIIDMAPGEVFVHRNVANVVVHTDLNCLSVIQYAIDVLKVAHIIAVGHYGCAGVGAALDSQRVGLADNWIRHVKDVKHKHRAIIEAIDDAEIRHDRLCELNAL